MQRTPSTEHDGCRVVRGGAAATAFKRPASGALPVPRTGVRVGWRTSDFSAYRQDQAPANAPSSTVPRIRRRMTHRDTQRGLGQDWIDCLIIEQESAAGRLGPFGLDSGNFSSFVGD